MAYIPLSITKFYSDEKRVYDLPLPVSGVNLSDGKKGKENGQCRKMSNFIPSDISLKSAGGFEEKENTSLSNGTFHGITKRPFCGKMIIHFGNSLYFFEDKEGRWELLYSGVPDKNSIFCEFSSKLYFYCGTYVYGIDRNFNCVEEFPDAPVYGENVNNETGIVTKKNKDFKVNLLAPRIGISYSAVESTAFKIPIKCDLTRPIKAYSGETQLEVNTEKCTDGKISLKKKPDGVNPIILEYYVADTEEIGFDNFFEGCRLCESYGGSDVGGTRIFAGGNDERTGEYCKSVVVNPLSFPSDGLEKFGNGSDAVTGFLKVYENLLIFTDRSVYKMSYSVNQNGGFFSVRQINQSVGCDIPGSIQLIDNRAVFANSKTGIYIADLSEDAGEYNIMPVSGNINDGKDGLLACGEDKLKGAFSVDSAGRYILCVGEKMFVWDYASCGYNPSYSYEKAQGGLIWYIWNQKAGDLLFEQGRNLFSLKSQDGTLFGYNESLATESEFLTEEYDFGCPTERKLPCEITVNLVLSKKTDVKITFYGDGKAFYGESFCSGQDGETFLTIRLPETYIHRFSYGINVTKGYFELKNATLKMNV